jgi:hypothetical protein
MAWRPRLSRSSSGPRRFRLIGSDRLIERLDVGQLLCELPQIRVSSLLAACATTTAARNAGIKSSLKLATDG